MDRSLNEIAYSVKETIRDYSDDSDISTDHIKYLINLYRSQYLKKDLRKPGRYVDESIKQDLGCLKLELIDPADCCDISTDCTILRTVKDIPDPIELYDAPLITSVGPVNKIKSRFSFVSYHRAIFSGNGDFNKDSIFAFYLNDKLYIKSNPDNMEAKLLEYINARGVFQDPSKIKDFEDCKTGNKCFDDDSKYPINSWMIPMVKEAVIQDTLRTLQTPVDPSNNSQDDRAVQNGNTE